MEEEQSGDISETSPLCDAVPTTDHHYKPILVDDLWAYVQEKKANNFDGLKKEYEVKLVNLFRDNRNVTLSVCVCVCMCVHDIYIYRERERERESLHNCLVVSLQVANTNIGPKILIIYFFYNFLSLR